MLVDMTWHGEQLDRIVGSEELQITTSRPDGTQRRWTPIWVVRVGDSLYIAMFLRAPATETTLRLDRPDA